MRLRSTNLIIIIILVLMLSLTTQIGQAQSVVVRAVLFFSPSCNHCHYIIDEVLPPLSEQYGSQIEVIGIDVTTDAGEALYQMAIDRFQVPDERLGVPTLIVGNQVLWGQNEIPELFPQIIENGILSGGIDWPDIPGLQQVLTASGYDSGSEIMSGDFSAPARPTWKENYVKDPIGNSVAVAVLLGMVISVIGVGHSFLSDSHSKYLVWPKWTFPILIAIGIVVASYLSYIEITKSDAVCGPIGDCSSVQESEYAYLFGVIPIGILGLFGYIAMLFSWLLHHYGPTNLQKTTILSVWGMAWFGLLFSIYLTFLEPFVIGATCAWCITSAIVITLLLWSTTGPALEAMRSDDEFEDDDFDEIAVENDDWASDASGPEDII